ncbi:MAG: M1 family metallopeptidase [Chloroflexi bacterium]|nr:M1 family metallopeptidase [Chloroflexota bacterium]
MKPWRLVTGLLIVTALLSAPAAIRPTAAQALPPWMEAYRPAMLPDFVPDMAAYEDAPRYTIDLAIAIDEQGVTLTGSQSVIYTNRTGSTPLDEIVFRLYPNLESYGGEMQIGAVTANGEAVDPALDETRSVLRVPLAAALEPGDRLTIKLDYTIVVVPGLSRLYAQFSYLDGVLALPNAYPVLSVYEPGRGWWDETAHTQGDAVYSETGFYTVHVTAPDDLILAASGSEVDLVSNPDGTLTHTYVAALMRDFILVGSTAYVSMSGEQDGVTVTLYYDPARPEAEANTRAGLEIALNSVRHFNAQFGRYPFAELDIVQTPTRAGGIEYPGLIVITDDSWNREDVFFEFVIVHETAHQWWYSLVGNDQRLDPWLDEALAQFAVAVFIREQQGAAAYEAAIESFRSQYNQYLERFPDAVIGQPVEDYTEGGAYFYLVYQKGPLFFADLADEFGYDAVIGMLRDYFAAYRYEVAEPQDMLNSFEATLGEDLNPLFEEWVGPFPVG